MRKISRRNTAIDKVVISARLTPEQTAPWHNTRIVNRADAHELLADRKRRQSKGKPVAASVAVHVDRRFSAGRVSRST